MAKQRTPAKECTIFQLEEQKL